MPKKTTLKKIAAVNVIHMNEGMLHSVRSFKDNVSGNKQAEKTFIFLIEERMGIKLSDDDVEYYLDEGYFANNGKEFFLTHSDTDPELI